MKANIHPVSYPTIFVDTSCGAEFFTVSTRKEGDARTLNGVTYQVIPIEISSASPPFYTGKQVLVDTARRVEKFQEKIAKTTAAAQIRKGKKAKKASAKGRSASGGKAAKSDK